MKITTDSVRFGHRLDITPPPCVPTRDNLASKAPTVSASAAGDGNALDVGERVLQLAVWPSAAGAERALPQPTDLPPMDSTFSQADQVELYTRYLLRAYDVAAHV